MTRLVGDCLSMTKTITYSLLFDSFCKNKKKLKIHYYKRIKKKNKHIMTAKSLIVSKVLLLS